MSRIGKKSIQLPAGVTVTLDPESSVVTVNGPKGQLTMPVRNFVSIHVEDGIVRVGVHDEHDRFQRAVWGTTQSLLHNCVHGVSQGFKKELELNGVGYKMELGSQLILHIGFSHPVKVDIPAIIKLSLNKNVLTGESIDKHALGDFFTTLHNMKPCDVYKHKGFRFPGRVYRKKVGKKAK